MSDYADSQMCQCKEGKIYVKKVLGEFEVIPCRRCGRTINIYGIEMDPKKRGL